MLTDLWIRLRALLRRKVVEAELDEELRFHYERQVEKNLRSGLTREEAVRQARLQIGGLDQVKEACREARGVGWAETLQRDLRYALRMLRRDPRFTSIAVLTLALGIGSTTATFSVIDAVLLRPLPYKDASRLVLAWETKEPDRSEHGTVTPPDFLEWQRQSTAFGGMAAVADERDNLTGNGEPEQVVVQLVTTDFFSLLGVQPVLGRSFTAEEVQPGKNRVVVLSYGLWQERFGGSPAIVGKTLEINGHRQTVVGVAPASFTWFIKRGALTAAKPRLWAPFVFPPSFHDRRQVGGFLTVVARLAPRVPLPRARSEMDAIAARIARDNPETNRHAGVNLVPLHEEIAGDLRPALLILLGAVALVLLIACANVSGLLLARAASREGEVAIRAAIGASRGRIARQLLTESLVLAAIGGTLGAAAAIVGTNVLLAASPENLLDLKSVGIDGRLLLFAAGVTLLAGLVFGCLPSYLSAHPRLADTLRQAAGRSPGGGRRRLGHSAFVVAQISLALVLCVGSGLLVRSFVRLLGVDPGFDPDRLLSFTVALPASRYGTDPARAAFFQQLLARTGRLPGVRSVSMSNIAPLAGQGPGTSVHILGQPARSLNDLPPAAVRVVGPEYFRTLGIPLRSGRAFSSVEMEQARHVVIVNRAFAEKYLPGENPLGKKAVIFMKSLEESGNEPSEIIGVAGDVHELGLDTAAEPTVYWPFPELVYSRMSILVRTATDPLALVADARREVRQLDPQLPLANVTTLQRLLGDSLARSRFTMLLLGLFGAAALALAAVGIYGVVTYSVAQRTHELGVRIALGAERRDLLRLVLEQGTRLTLLGIGAGIVGALAFTRLLASLLFGVGTTDPLTFAAVAVLLALAVLGACWIPARRAMRVDPMAALRHQ
ncbi:MAG TPA: ABC transporter permease [Thermoanaerobaculia bacterium]|nr:ABC transporter permease [Thermoanaerobaculia bacterium]